MELQYVLDGAMIFHTLRKDNNTYLPRIGDVLQFDNCMSTYVVESVRVQHITTGKYCQATSALVTVNEL